MHLDPPAGLAGERDQLARQCAAVERDEESERVRPGPLSRGVTHETIASPAGKGCVPARPQAARGGRRLAIVRAELDCEIRRTRPILLAAVDEAVGKEPERELSRRLCVHSEPVSSKTRKPWLRPATRAATTRGSTGICCQPSRSGGEASAIRQVVPPLPRTTWQRSPPPIDQGRSGCRRWRNVAPPGWIGIAAAGPLEPLGPDAADRHPLERSSPAFFRCSTADRIVRPTSGLASMSTRLISWMLLSLSRGAPPLLPSASGPTSETQASRVTSSRKGDGD